MSQESLPVARIRSAPGLLHLTAGFVGISLVFAIVGPLVLFFRSLQGAGVDMEAWLGLSRFYLLFLAALFVYAMTRTTLNLSGAGLRQQNGWRELLGIPFPRERPGTLLLWREIQRIGMAFELRRGGVMSCKLIISSATGAIRVGISVPECAAIADAVAARLPGLEIEPAASLVLGLLRQQGPAAVHSALQRAACRFAMERGFYRLLCFRKDWWDELRESPELRRDFVDHLNKYFP